MDHTVAVLLHNIRSAHNVGSIFRTAEAAGVSKVFLTGHTSAPIDRFGRVQKEIAKTALAAESFLEWSLHRSALPLMRRLKREGWRIVGVEQDERAKDYSLIRANKRTVYVFGNEVDGLNKKILDECDAIIEIPMRGKKESLNVSVAAGIILFSFH